MVRKIKIWGTTQFIHTWSHDAQPNWKDIEESIIEMMDEDFKPHFYDMSVPLAAVNGVLISTEGMESGEALSLFLHIYNLPES